MAVHQNLPMYGSKLRELKHIYKIIETMGINTEEYIFIDLFGGSGIVSFNLPFKFKKIIYNEVSFKRLQIIEYLNEPTNIDELNNFIEAGKPWTFELVEELDHVKKTLILSKLGWRGYDMEENYYIRHDVKLKNFNVVGKNVFWKAKNKIDNFYNRDYEEILNRLDPDEKFLIYMDPPYPNTNYQYGKNFTFQDYKKMLKFLPSQKCIFHTRYEAYIMEEYLKPLGISYIAYPMCFRVSSIKSDRNMPKYQLICYS